jgi:hypothetical protein
LRRATVLVSLLVTLLASTITGTAAAVPTIPDGGVVIQGTNAEAKRAMDLAHAAGVRWISLAAPWAPMEPQPDSYRAAGGPGTGTWTGLEELLLYARSLGLKSELRLFDAPSWASGRDAVNDPPTPANVAAYGDFLGDLATRLGPHVDAYTPWNEANLATFWSPVDVGAYTTLQKVAYRALKAADPTATVLSTNVVGSFDFLRASYRAGLAGHADAIGWTSYPTNAAPEITYLDSSGRPLYSSLPAQLHLRGVIDEFDPGRKVWIMEFGWSTCSPRCTPYPDKTVSEAEQADYLVRSFEFRRRYLTHVTERIFWYAMRDLGTDRADWNQNHGLVRTDFSPKPAYAALSRLAFETGGPGPERPGAAPESGAGSRLIPLAALRLTLPPSASSARGRTTLGRLRLTSRRGVLRLRLPVKVTGGPVRVRVDAYRPRRWRLVRILRIPSSGTLTLRFPDQAYLAVRVRATVPGRSGWRVGRRARVPGLRVRVARPVSRTLPRTARRVAIPAGGSGRAGRTALEPRNARVREPA